eukprot:m.22054 g.22054  ORF g.22054 m.22054 type:complete len:384 (-) comp7327_c0_seq1:80-1231(-)
MLAKMAALNNVVIIIFQLLLFVTVCVFCFDGIYHKLYYWDSRGDFLYWGKLENVKAGITGYTVTIYFGFTRWAILGEQECSYWAHPSERDCSRLNLAFATNGGNVLALYKGAQIVAANAVINLILVVLTMARLRLPILSGLYFVLGLVSTLLFFIPLLKGKPKLVQVTYIDMFFVVLVATVLQVLLSMFVLREFVKRPEFKRLWHYLNRLWTSATATSTSATATLTSAGNDPIFPFSPKKLATEDLLHKQLSNQKLLINLLFFAIGFYFVIDGIRYLRFDLNPLPEHIIEVIVGSCLVITFLYRLIFTYLQSFYNRAYMEGYQNSHTGNVIYEDEVAIITTDDSNNNFNISNFHASATTDPNVNYNATTTKTPLPNQPVNVHY